MFIVCKPSFLQKHLFSRLAKWRTRQFLLLLLFLFSLWWEPLLKKANLNLIPEDKETFHFTAWSLHYSGVTPADNCAERQGQYYNYLHKTIHWVAFVLEGFFFLFLYSLFSPHDVAWLRGGVAPGASSGGGGNGRRKEKASSPSPPSSLLLFISFFLLFNPLTTRGLRWMWTQKEQWTMI